MLPPLFFFLLVVFSTPQKHDDDLPCWSYFPSDGHRRKNILLSIAGISLCVVNVVAFFSSLFLSALRTSCSCCRKTSYERMPPFSAVSITSLNKTESWASLDYTSRCDSMFPARCSSDRQNADKTKKTELTRPLWRRSRFLPIKFWGGKEKTKRRGKQGKTPPPLSTASSYNNNKNITSMYNERYVI